MAADVAAGVGALVGALGIVLLAAGCSTPSGPVGALTIPEIAEVESDRFAAGRRLLSGDPVDLSADALDRSGGSWRPGDSILLGIAIDAGAERREWYLRARALGKLTYEVNGAPLAMGDSIRVRSAGGGDWVRIDYDLVRVAVELFDGRGLPLSGTEALMPEVCLQHGLYDYIEQSLAGNDIFAQGSVIAGPDGELVAAEPLRRAVAGWIAIMKLPEFLQRDSGMDQLLWRLVDRPGIVSMLTHRGLQFEIGLTGKDARPDSAGGQGPAYRVPVMMTLNGRPAVRCEIVVTRGDAPLGPCNGLLSLDATHPSDPSRRIAVRLLAAQRGRP